MWGKFTRNAAIALAISSVAAAYADTTGSTGGDQPHSTVQPSIGLQYIVRTDVPAGALQAYVGEITLYAGFYVPNGWAALDGSLLNKADHLDLFNAIGTTYGGDGVTTFGLPDFRGRTAIGVGQGPGLSNYAMGQTAGTETVTLGVNNLPSHNHTLPPTADVTGNTGAGAAFNNMQPSIAVNYLIATDKNFVFPQDPFTFAANAPVLGQVRMSLLTAAPTGWNVADGSIISIALNTPLFSLFGTTYGGNGSTTFGLPDLRGRAAIGTGTGQGLSNQTIGQVQGDETTVMLETTMAAHTHTTSGPLTGPTGGSQPNNNMQPTVALNFIIALQGDVPPRDGGSPTFDLDEPFLGQIMLWGANFAPDGWAFCEGQLLPIVQAPDLFNMIGDAFGGNGTTTFGLPDLRGRIPVGVGTGAGLSTWNFGDESGVEDNTLSVNQLAAHVHEIPVPEPASLGLLAVGAAGLLMRRRR
jgi:microcystin-dependent protein